MSKLQKMFIRCLYFLGLRLCKIPTVAVSRKLGEILKNSFYARVEVVENGVDTAVFFHDPEAELISSKNGRKAIVALARSEYRKGFDLVPEVLQLVQKRSDEHFELWTVGDNFFKGGDGLKHRHFGNVNEARLRQIFSSADLFLYPTRYEGFGLMILEAISCHCPFVTTEAVPAAEDGIGGSVCPVDNVDSLAGQVLTFFEPTSRRDEILQKGVEATRAYNLKNCQKRFEQTLCAIAIGDSH